VLAIKVATYRMVFNNLCGVNFISPLAISLASSTIGSRVISRVRY
jgi:hypothetical protein